MTGTGTATSVGLRMSLIPDGVVERLMAERGVRHEAVARARARLADASPCPAEAVAATLVDCMVAGRMP